MSSGAGGIPLLILLGALAWGSCYGWRFAPWWLGGGRAGDGHAGATRREEDLTRVVRRSAARGFSLYVVASGLGPWRACPDSVQPSW